MSLNAWAARCPVGANCRVPTHCPYCVDGSEYRPVDRAIRFPTTVARAAARRSARTTARQSAASQRGRRSARKGRRAEQDAVRYFGGRRVPLSGALDGLDNDVVLPNGWRAEVKARAAGLSWLYADLRQHDWVGIRGPDGRWLVAMTGARWRVGFSPQDRAAVRAVPWRLGSVTTDSVSGCLKARARVDTLWQWLAAESADVLLFKADRQGWLVMCDTPHWVAWLAGEPTGVPQRPDALDGRPHSLPR
jgi:hypothetical protein